MDTIYIQLEDNGNWLTVSSMPSGSPQSMSMEMRTLKRTHPERRVRAVDGEGRLLDLMP
jgi:hypothetical protein